MILTNNTLLITLIGGILVQIGVSLKNGGSQMKLKGKFHTIIGTIAFILGWLILAISIGLSDGKLSLKTLLAFVSVFGIVSSVMLIKVLKMEKIGGPLFMGSWILFGLSVGMGRNMSGKIMGIISSVLVILSMTQLLPYQRENKIVDLPGYNMFSSAFFLIAMANALVNPNSMGLKSLAA